jgi:site-specific recombinase XerD
MKSASLSLVPPASGLTDRVTDFLNEKRAAALSRRTVAQYTDVLREVLLPFCRGAGITEPSQITAAQLNALSAGLLDGTGTRSGKALSKASVASYARAINVFLGWLAKEGETGNARVQKPRVKKQLRDTLSREEIRALEDAAPNERDKLIVRVLGDTGMRVAELLGLDLDCVRQEPGRKWYLKVLGKGDKERMVPITPGLAARIERYAQRTRKEAPSDRLFLGNRRHPESGQYEPFTESGCEQMISDLGAQVLNRRVYPHLFRHSFITEQLRRGMTPVLIAQIVGHESLTMIMEVYQQLTVTDAHEALMKSLLSEKDRGRR